MGKPLSEMTREELWQLFPIVLAEYDPEWPDWFRDESEAIRLALGGDAIARMSHIGSTAVEGMTAKPTVDILLEVRDVSDMAAIVTRLEAAGWRWHRRPTADVPEDDAVLNKGYTEQGFAARVFHLHVRAHGDWDELYFRDRLREDAAVREEYARLKGGLVGQYRHNRDAYTDAKTEFVKRHTAIARERYGGRYRP